MPRIFKPMARGTTSLGQVCSRWARNKEGCWVLMLLVAADPRQQAISPLQQINMVSNIVRYVLTHRTKTFC